jgi:hypothetical protein
LGFIPDNPAYEKLSNDSLNYKLAQGFYQPKFSALASYFYPSLADKLRLTPVTFLLSATGVINISCQASALFLLVF